MDKPKLFVQSDGENKIFVRLSYIEFMASPIGVTLFLDDDLADKLSFQIGSCLQDKDVVKNKLDKISL
jgi:hypothetical protein